MKYREMLLVLVFALVAASPASADQRLSDLLLQIQRLQQEVQQLRGQVELQQIERLGNGYLFLRQRGEQVR